MSPLDPHAVLSAYPAAVRGEVMPVAGGDGFSGARVWCVGKAFCLRAWPAKSSAEQVHFVHELMHLAQHLEFVPRVMVTNGGDDAVSAGGRWWDLATWRPGRAEPPTVPRVRAACAALARLHRAWERRAWQTGECPGVRRRLDVLQWWQDRGRWHGLDPLGCRAAVAVARFAPEAARRLAGWGGMAVQPCHCDVWPANVLFEQDAVSGIIDFGSAKMDHVAVDLARLVGSFAEDDASLRAEAVEAYAALRPLAPWERQLVEVLDWTGAVVAAANWLRWRWEQRRPEAWTSAAMARFEAMVQRLERW